MSPTGITLLPTRGQAFERLKGLDDYALNGRRILITAPQQYAAKLSARIVQKGGRPVWIPSIQVSPLRDAEKLAKLDATLTQLSTYSHLLFTSKNGISAFLSRLEQVSGSQDRAVELLKSSGMKIYALGADADVLRAAGITALTPKEASTQVRPTIQALHPPPLSLCPHTLRHTFTQAETDNQSHIIGSREAS